MMSNSYTTQLVEVIYQSAPHIPEEAITEAKKGLTDYLASSYAASKEDAVLKLTAFTLDEGGLQTAPVIGQQTMVSALQSAFLNGFIGHYLDFDDVHEEIRGHPSTVILPALLALASEKDMTYQHFLHSYIIGVETMARIGRTIGSWHYERGWHNTSTIGNIAAAAAVAFALQLPQDKFAAALGIAVTQSSGLRGQFGTEVKPMHAGLAARNGLFAVKLAASSAINGSSTMLEQFYSVYSDKTSVPVDLTLHWGRKWSIVSPGLWFKIYPCCSAAYHTIDATRQILKDKVIDPNTITGINIIFPSGGDAALISKQPITGEEGRFSAEYVCAALLTFGHLEASHFNSDKINSTTKQLMSKIKRTYDDSIVPSTDSVPKDRFTIVEMTMQSGEIHSARCDAPEGSSSNPLSMERLQDKLAEHLPSHHSVQDYISSIQNAECTSQVLNLLKEK
jgi:2-methylcitrate dehydratase PrpD